MITVIIFKIWIDAAIQNIFSLSCTIGGLGTLSCYNRINHNLYRDVISITIANCLTSILSGCVFICYLPRELYENDGISKFNCIIFAFKEIPKTFILEEFEKISVHPQAISILFYLMLITFGLDTMTTLVETLITALLDQFKVCNL